MFIATLGWSRASYVEFIAEFIADEPLELPCPILRGNSPLDLSVPMKSTRRRSAAYQMLRIPCRLTASCATLCAG